MRRLAVLVLVMLLIGAGYILISTYGATKPPAVNDIKDLETIMGGNDFDQSKMDDVSQVVGPSTNSELFKELDALEKEMDSLDGNAFSQNQLSDF